MNWENLLKVYEDMGVEDIIPIAHTRILPHIKVLLDENGNYIGAMLMVKTVLLFHAPLNLNQGQVETIHIRFMTICNICRQTITKKNTTNIWNN